VGFPGETDEDFEQTVELAKWAGFSKIHTFPFSSRMGTPASRMKNKVESKIIKQRAHILRKVSDELGRKFVEQFVGETCEVLLEDAEPLSGRSERYFMVFLTTRTQRHEENQNSLVPSSLSGKGEIVKVRITEATSEGATGEEVKS
jgi:threonylcarbamoyladenosine tRNA methylthiotransferase MtaB